MCAFFMQGFETAWSDSCWSPEEDYEQPSRNEGAAGQRDGAIVTCVLSLHQVNDSALCKQALRFILTKNKGEKGKTQ